MNSIAESNRFAVKEVWLRNWRRDMNRVCKMGVGEIIERKSRFIAHVFYIENEAAAVSYINEVKKKYWDARHNCFAYVLGNQNEIQRFSDDGEPSGTAGKPILEVIEKQQLVNCLIVVTRYFGGTLLGTGGLIRAYQAASKEGISSASVVPILEGIKASILTDYNNFGKLQYLCTENHVEIISAVYDENVHLSIIVEKSLYNNFIKQVTERFAGRITLQDIEQVMYSIGESKAEFFSVN